MLVYFVGLIIQEKTQGFRQYTIYIYGSNTYRRNYEPIIRTEYIHNTHYENPPQNNITLYIDDLFVDIHRILWYIRIVVEFCTLSSSEAQAVRPMCGVIRLRTFVRFVRYVITMVRDYYTLLRSRSALCLYGFCRMAFQLFGILERDERAFYASSSLFVSTDYGKTPTIHPCASLIH